MAGQKNPEHVNAIQCQAEEARLKLPFENRDLFRLFLPLVIEQFLEFTVGLGSSMMVASVGEAAVSGVSIVDFIMMFLINILTALATGGAVVIGQYLGQGEISSARKSGVQLILLNTCVALIIMLLLYGVKSWILGWIFGQIDSQVIQHAHTYLLYVAASIPFMAIYIAGAAIFRSMGNAIITMKIALGMNGINLAVSAILLFVYHYGTQGVGLAALLARAGGALMICFLLCQQKLSLNIAARKLWTWNWDLVKRILGIGVPFGLENSVFYIGRIAVLSLVASFGTTAIAANAVGGTLVMFQVLPGMAINVGMTAVISRCVGMDRFDLAKFYHNKILRTIFMAQIAINALIWILFPWLMQLYALSAPTQELVRQIAISHGIASILIWPWAYTLPVTFRASGDARYPLKAGIVTMIACRLLMAYILAKYLHLGLMGTWFAMYLDWILRALLFSWRYLNGKWMRFRVI